MFGGVACFVKAFGNAFILTSMPDFEESLFGATSRYRVHETNSFPIIFLDYKYFIIYAAKMEQRQRRRAGFGLHFVLEIFRFRLRNAVSPEAVCRSTEMPDVKEHDPKEGPDEMFGFLKVMKP